MDDYECEKGALRGFFERKSRMKDARERTRVFFVEPNLEWFRSNITFLQPFEMLTISKQSFYETNRCSMDRCRNLFNVAEGSRIWALINAKGGGGAFYRAELSTRISDVSFDSTGWNGAL